MKTQERPHDIVGLHRDNVADNNAFIECPKVQAGGFNLNNLLWEEARKKGTATDPLYLARYPDLKLVFDPSGFNHLWRNVDWNCPPHYQGRGARHGSSGSFLLQSWFRPRCSWPLRPTFTPRIILRAIPSWT